MCLVYYINYLKEKKKNHSRSLSRESLMVPIIFFFYYANPNVKYHDLFSFFVLKEKYHDQFYHYYFLGKNIMIN